MKIDLENEQNNVVKINIEIPAKDAVSEYNKAVKKISEYVNIPGFRKGKAPRNIIEQNVGQDKIKQEALESMLPRAIQEAIISNKLDIIAQPYVESYDFNVGKDVKIVAKAELRPQVTMGDYKGMKLEVEGFENPADAAQKSIDSLIEQHATFEVVVDRPSKNDDTVVFDFDGTVNGEKIQGGAAENYSLDLAHSNFIPGFAEQLVGKNINDEFDINVTFPKEYHEAKLAGQPAVFKIKMKEIKQKVLPELTDEFAQKVGPFKTVDDLKADVQKYLDAKKENENKRLANNAIFEKVLENITVDVQETMIDREAQALLDEYKQRLAGQGIDWQKAIESQGQNEVMEGLKKEALTRIKNSLVIDKIAELENIKIEPADLEGKLQELQNAYHISKEDLMKQLSGNSELFSSLSQQALNEKVASFLAENNTIEFKAPKAKKAKATK
ncbi:trigger factor [bacterium]|nr:trigger factor [bacterium]